jgi:hypothetical protein
MKETTTPTDLDLRDALDELRELIDRRDSISYKLMAVTLDADDPVTYDQYQVMLGREERLTKRVGDARQEVRRIKMALVAQ